MVKHRNTQKNLRMYNGTSWTGKTDSNLAKMREVAVATLLGGLERRQDKRTTTTTTMQDDDGDGDDDDHNHQNHNNHQDDNHHLLRGAPTE